MSIREAALLFLYLYLAVGNVIALNWLLTVGFRKGRTNTQIILGYCIIVTLWPAGLTIFLDK